MLKAVKPRSLKACHTLIIKLRRDTRASQELPQRSCPVNVAQKIVVRVAAVGSAPSHPRRRTAAALSHGAGQSSALCDGDERDAQLLSVLVQAFLLVSAATVCLKALLVAKRCYDGAYIIRFPNIRCDEARATDSADYGSDGNRG